MSLIDWTGSFHQIQVFRSAFLRSVLAEAAGAAAVVGLAGAVAGAAAAAVGAAATAVGAAAVVGAAAAAAGLVGAAVGLDGAWPQAARAAAPRPAMATDDRPRNRRRE